MPADSTTPSDSSKATALNSPSEAASTSQTPGVPYRNSPGTLVLQWLTYAFWGWTVIALGVLMANSVSFFLNISSRDSSDSAAVAYSLAAVIVLFVISLVCDLLYSRVEPLHKQGAATIIMIVHAVLFALFGIASLIAAVFAVVRLIIGDAGSSNSGDDGALTVLVTGLSVALIFGATLLRTLRPFKLKRSALVYWFFMALVTAGITVLGIVGPTTFASQTRNDRLVEASLPEVAESVRLYADKTSKLPVSLADVSDSLSPKARELINKQLVDYKPGEKVGQSTNAPSGVIIQPKGSRPIYQYELCVTYVARKGSGSIRPSGNDVDPNTYSHSAGRVCYKLVTDYSYNYDKQLY